MLRPENAHFSSESHPSLEYLGITQHLGPWLAVDVKGNTEGKHKVNLLVIKFHVVQRLVSQRLHLHHHV